MTQVPSPTKSVVSRRKLIASGATLIAGGGAVTILGTRRAAASVSLNVPDQTHTGKDGTVSGLLLNVDGTYQYGADAVDTIELTLSVTPSDQTNYQQIGHHEDPVTSTEGTGQFGLSGSILDHTAFEASGFSAGAGETVSRDVGARVSLDIVSGGEIVASDHATDTATVTVENTTVATTVAISADGTIDIQV